MGADTVANLHGTRKYVFKCLPVTVQTLRCDKLASSSVRTRALYPSALTRVNTRVFWSGMGIYPLPITYPSWTQDVSKIPDTRGSWTGIPMSDLGVQIPLIDPFWLIFEPIVTRLFRWIGVSMYLKYGGNKCMEFLRTKRLVSYPLPVTRIPDILLSGNG